LGKNLLVVVLVVGLLVTVMWFLQRRLIYLPGSDAVGARPAGWESVSLPTEDGLELDAWLRPPDDGAPVVVVFPGNAGNRRNRLSLGNGLAERGLGVLLVDYRGYGDNEGAPSEDGLALDAAAALGFVRAEGLDGAGVVYFGESLGAGVAVGLASAEPPAALVLRSPFTSLPDAASVHYPFLPVDKLLRDRYPSLDRATSITAPVFVIAGDADGTIPIEQSRRLAGAFPGTVEFLVIPGADHNDAALSSGAGMLDAVARFIFDVTD
jgi:fermentation-respiration switch protein FrsA (DUF1100 family)